MVEYYVIQLYPHDLFYDGSDTVRDYKITNDNFSEIDSAMFFSEKEDAMIELEKAVKNVYGALALVQIYR